MSILDEILAHKRGEVEQAKRREPPERVAERARSRPEEPRSLRRALLAAEPPAVIAEIKRRSPSRGEIRPELDPVGIAKAYADAGAAAISVLTDERYFGGSLAILEAVRRSSQLPILRKDFVIDAYQLDEARAAGADAVLLIVAALDPGRLEELRGHAQALGLDALVEVHDAEELEVARAVGADLIGINNRNLRSFATDLAVTEELAPRAPAGAVVVAESGIFSYADVQRLQEAGADAFLVGESLMREADVGLALRRIRGIS